MSAPATAPDEFLSHFPAGSSEEEVSRLLGYGFAVAPLALPLDTGTIDWVAKFQHPFEYLPGRVDLSKDRARREFLVAPVLIEVILACRTRVRSDVFVEVGDRFRGTFNHLLEGRDELFVVAARGGDMRRGSSELTAALAAMDNWTETGVARLYGAATNGSVWRFGTLDRAARQITLDARPIVLPDEMERLARVLVGIVNALPPETPATTA
jgi:hypothetical protein